jgi:succinate dehydrogenase flavin-adding protein (antitoxin of CptAB toxin-antitoxin module)
MTQTEINRLRWHCRRGMLENDLVLERFMDLHGERLEGDRLEAFKRLLALSDGELWDLVCGRAATTDPAEAEITSLLQQCTPAGDLH